MFDHIVYIFIRTYVFIYTRVYNGKGRSNDRVARINISYFVSRCYRDRSSRVDRGKKEKKRRKFFFKLSRIFLQWMKILRGGFSHGEGAKKKYRSIDITDIWIYQSDTVKRDRDEYWIARWKQLVKLVSNLSDLWKRRVSGFVLVRLIINLCQQMCRRHWFKSPLRWLTLPNLVCLSRLA